MKNYKLWAALALVAAVIFWGFFGSDSQAKTQTGVINTFEASEVQPAVPEVQKIKTQHPNTKAKDIQFDGSIRVAAKQVVSQYQSALRFPKYSQPLSKFDTDRLTPNMFYPVSMPIDEQGGKLTVKLAKYRFIYPENIHVNISGAEIDKVSVTLMDVDTKTVLKTQSLVASQSSYDIKFKANKDYPRNLQVVAKVTVQNKKVPVVAQLQYMQPSAKLLSIGNAYSDNDKMSVPLHLEVFKAGNYRIRANLYASGEPIAHLTTKGKLSEGLQNLSLSAHWSVLNPQASSMSLSEFVIELMSPSPAQPSLFGSSEIKHFEINDFVFDSLQQLPYQPSAKELKSLTFLQNLAN
ncbi:hypothetical protein CWB96_22465 [Pseudoalteromonas citrea]|uniref:Uncharacterized protein n=1 Tax=Pseudoalteromonas citrea TaxID=43655 RepID=A0A5S3XGU0_9GAMM|nr:hypothetical protein [Pseudoalteromonas citrea]TMP37833.1 hypothetical protein CWB97_22530 [Pseudoalteromonas citrea]TMP51214.1 hypothetical protein CWB96_22465 [Pseudoalteromonas citrea]